MPTDRNREKERKQMYLRSEKLARTKQHPAGAKSNRCQAPALTPQRNPIGLPDGSFGFVLPSAAAMRGAHSLLFNDHRFKYPLTALLVKSPNEPT